MTTTSSDIEERRSTIEDAFQEDEEWFVNHVNIRDALLAFADRQPKLLVILRTGRRVHEPIPKATLKSVAKAAKNCRVWLNLYDSFFNPKLHETDLEVLEYFLNNPTVYLGSFIGHLNSTGIKKLPTTLKSLGLSINCVEDSNSISELKLGKNFQSLDLAITRDVAGSVLSSAPSIDHIVLHFPSLDDDWVDSVKLAIGTVKPELALSNLIFPNCKLSAAGVEYLVKELQGISLGGVEMEMCGDYQPDEKEKERHNNELLYGSGCEVQWSLEWFH